MSANDYKAQKGAVNTNAPKDETKPEDQISNLQKAQILSQLEAKRPLASEQPDKFDYFVGCTPDSKKFFITVGGHSFPRYNCKVARDQSGQDTEIPMRGGIIKLSTTEAVKLQESILRKGLRFVAGGSTTFLVEKSFQENEYPLAMFIYLRKVEDLIKFDPAGWRESLDIPPIMARDEHTKKKIGDGWNDPEGNPIPLIPPHVEDKMDRKDFQPQK